MGERSDLVDSLLYVGVLEIESVSVEVRVGDRELVGESVSPLCVAENVGDSSSEFDGVSDVDPERRFSLADHVCDPLDRVCLNVSVYVMEVDVLPEDVIEYVEDDVKDLTLKDNSLEGLMLLDEDNE